ncbi:MAG: hypothetical protein AAAC47_24525, partial [Pararhizobium sp.]
INVSGMVSLPDATAAAPQDSGAPSLPFSMHNPVRKCLRNALRMSEQSLQIVRLIRMKLLSHLIKRIPDYITLT